MQIKNQPVAVPSDSRMRCDDVSRPASSPAASQDVYNASSIQPTRCGGDSTDLGFEFFQAMLRHTVR